MITSLRTKVVNTSLLCNFSRRAASTSSSSTLSVEELDKDQLPASFEESPEEERKIVNQDKSGLLPQHRNMLHGKVPYSEPHSWIHLSQKYQRKLYGKYGAESGIDPRICFDTQADLQKKQEYMKVAYPKTLQEMMSDVQAEKAAKLEAIKKREDDIAKKLAKLEDWKKELNAKKAKSEADALAAKARKERLIEEVRRHFGFKVDPRDERFKEMLEQKEKEDKRKQKEAKKKVKEQKMMEKLVGKAADNNQKVEAAAKVE